MRLILALLIATVAGVGMGYWAGYGNGVSASRSVQQRQAPPEYFDDYYADPATRPAEPRLVPVPTDRRRR